MEKKSGDCLNSEFVPIKLSVIVPVYNVEEYLPKCIESILKQTYCHMEILLVDDGSTDNCPQICDMYLRRDKRIKVIHKANEGLVRARKAGLDIAMGEYITFVDGDDWIEADMYLRLMELLEASRADFIDSGYFCDKDGKSYKERCLKSYLYELGNTVRHKIFLSLLDLEGGMDIRPCIWSKIFKAEIIKDSYRNVPDAMQNGEDAINLLYCVLKAKKMLQVKEIFYHYNYREESMSHKKSVSYVRRELELWKYCGDIILNHDEYMMQKDIDCCLFKKLYFAFQYLLSNEFEAIQYFRFPCIERVYGKRLAIYGAGKVGRDYITQISKYEKCNIVCWVDKNYKNLWSPYRKIAGIEEIFKSSYDIVLIAVAKRETAEEIRQILLEKGVLDIEILWCEPQRLF